MRSLLNSNRRDVIPTLRDRDQTEDVDGRSPPRTWRRTSAQPLRSGSRDPLLQLGKVSFVVHTATADDVVRFIAAVQVVVLDRITDDEGTLVICEEVVIQARDHSVRAYKIKAPASRDRVDIPLSPAHF